MYLWSQSPGVGPVVYSVGGSYVKKKKKLLERYLMECSTFQQLGKTCLERIQSLAEREANGDYQSSPQQ